MLERKCPAVREASGRLVRGAPTRPGLLAPSTASQTPHARAGLPASGNKAACDGDTGRSQTRPQQAGGTSTAVPSAQCPPDSDTAGDTAPSCVRGIRMYSTCMYMCMCSTRQRPPNAVQPAPRDHPGKRPPDTLQTAWAFSQQH
jgi:hypothetical protein